MKKTKGYLFLLLVGYIAVSSLNSCSSSKRLSYFNNITKDTVVMLKAMEQTLKIHKSDILQVTFLTTDPQEMGILNGGTTAGAGGAAAAGATNGLIVDDKGEIILPQIGVLKVEGLTKDELVAILRKYLIDKELSLNPIITVRVLNYRITVLGEVNRPGIIPIPNEKVTLPEALGLAGDLTPYGRRNNVLLIRLVDNKIVYKRFSLNDDAVFRKDLYFLQNQDMIYVEPNNAKAFSSDQITQIIPLILSSLSVLAVVLALFIRR